MATTTTPIVVDRAPATKPKDVSAYELDCALSEANVWPDAIDALPDGHPAIRAWEDMRDEVIEEVTVDLARAFDEALQRRLPWTWGEGEDR